MNSIKKALLPCLLPVLMLGSAVTAQSHKEFKLPLHWNRLYDYDEIAGISARIAASWPNLVSRISIGKSYEGREMWMLVLNNPDTGTDISKPAFYSDANIHGNEVQGSEANLYLVWYLLEHYGKVEKITELVDRVAFYVLLTVNPDGRAAWFRDPNTSSSQRTPQYPKDDDRDGSIDEDPAEDINGDGEITRMRKRVPLGEGDWRESPDHPGLMERVRGEIKGDFLMLGTEGIDNDDDGRFNEDGAGSYDMNRNWPSGWNPDHLQRGAGEYPLSHPEARSIADFVLAHPNIAGVQAFHNAGGMILRGPGVVEYGTYPRNDVRVYDALGEAGEFMLPFYRYMIIYKDLYSVAGGFVNWTYEGLGIFSFTNEMWSNQRMMQGTKNLSQAERRKWEDLLTFGEYYVPWQEFTHPHYGDIEIGGSRKMTGRVPPSWLIEEDLHRNSAFVIHHAGQMPKIELTGLRIRPAPGGLHYVDVKARNDRIIPSRSALAAKEKIGTPDRMIFIGDGLEVVAGGRTQDPFRIERIDLQDHNPRVLLGENGVPGNGDWEVRWIVAGTGTFKITYEAEKAANQEIGGEIK